MLFPGSRIWYEGAASDLASLTDEIKASGFSGHVVLEFQDSIDVVICVGGEFLRVIEKIGRRILTTKKYREIWGKCQIKQGRMTVFELPPPLVRRVRSLHGRRLLASGTASTGCDPAKMLDNLRDAGFSGTLDCVSPAGKMLLDIERGEIVGCYTTEYTGLSQEGLAAFIAWHQGYIRSTRPFFFFVSEAGGADGMLLDEILMDNADQVPLPLTGSLERLFGAYGHEAQPGEIVVGAGEIPGRAIYLLSGEVELIPREASAWSAGPVLRPGDLFGLSWLGERLPSPVTLRARTPARYLALDAAALEIVFANSPVLAARVVRESARALRDLRARAEAFRAEPRLRDVDAVVRQSLLANPRGGSEGISAAELFRDLTQSLPLSLPEIDALFRRLSALSGLSQAAGKISLVPREY